MPACALTNWWNSVAILIEHRFCARQLDRGRDDIGANDLGMLADVSLRHDHRIFDQRLSLLREQTVEPAVERDARNHSDQNRGNRGDQRKQGDDAHMQPRRRPAAPARLQNAPNFPADKCQQQKNREGIHQQQREDDLMGRQNWREIGKHHKGRKRRQQRERHRDRANKPPQPTRRWRRGGGEFGRSDLADVRHEVRVPTGQVM